MRIPTISDPNKFLEVEFEDCGETNVYENRGTKLLPDTFAIPVYISLFKINGENHYSIVDRNWVNTNASVRLDLDSQFLRKLDIDMEEIAKRMKL